MSYAVIIPTYNNAGTLAGVIKDVQQYAENVIVVNDGSTDSTASVLESIPGIDVVSYVQNRGKGYALRCGFERARRQGFRYAITIDADGQLFAEDIPAFLERIEQVPDSLLIGARNLSADGMPSKNTFANRFSNFWYRVETGRKLADTQCGFRLYPLEKLSDMKFFSRKYEFEVEIITRAAWRGINVENVPVKVHYPPKQERVSHFRPFRDFFRISVLNTVLVLYALLVYYPWRFVRALTLSNIKAFFDRYVFHSPESNLRMSAAMGWGVFCGIIPIWGYQTIFALATAHFMKLNKVVAVTFSNVSIPPMIPFILYGSIWTGAFLLNEPMAVTFSNISFESIGQSLLQYILGSVVLAAVSALAVQMTAWLLMIVCKRK